MLFGYHKKKDGGNNLVIFTAETLNWLESNNALVTLIVVSILSSKIFFFPSIR